MPQLAALGPVFKTCAPVQVGCLVVSFLGSPRRKGQSTSRSRLGCPANSPSLDALLLQLTEEETEYKVVCVRHILESHVVLQYHCTNTVHEQARPAGLEAGSEQ